MGFSLSANFQPPFGWEIPTKFVVSFKGTFFSPKITKTPAQV